MKHLHELPANLLKLWSPSAAFLGMVSIGNVKEAVVILGGLVTIGCTLAVAMSTIRKNNAEVRAALAELESKKYEKK